MESLKSKTVCKNTPLKREKLRVSLPEKVKKIITRQCNYDSVDYSAKTKTKTEPIVANGAPCYSGLDKKYNLYEITCTFHNIPVLEKDDYLEYFSLAREAGLIQDEIKLEWNDEGKPGVTMAIPQGLPDIHRTYATLCLYRWADSLPAVPWYLIQADRKHRGRGKRRRNFYQLLHYAIAEANIVTDGHSFIPTSYYIHKPGWKDATLGLGTKYHFDGKDLEDRCKQREVNKAIADVCQDWFPTIKKVGKSSWDSTYEACYKIEHPADLLDPRLVDLFQLEKPTSQTIQEILEPLGA